MRCTRSGHNPARQRLSDQAGKPLGGRAQRLAVAEEVGVAHQNLGPTRGTKAKASVRAGENVLDSMPRPAMAIRGRLVDRRGSATPTGYVTLVRALVWFSVLVPTTVTRAWHLLERQSVAASSPNHRQAACRFVENRSTHWVMTQSRWALVAACAERSSRLDLLTEPFDASFAQGFRIVPSPSRRISAYFRSPTYRPTYTSGHIN
jgi:hypothetical protein